MRKNIGKPKTMEDWHNSDYNNFDDFCQIGDVVAEDIVEEFANVLPPITYRSDMVQCSEPVDSGTDPEDNRWKSTYTTFVKEKDNWIYKGDCFCGKTTGIPEHVKLTTKLLYAYNDSDIALAIQLLEKGANQEIIEKSIQINGTEKATEEQNQICGYMLGMMPKALIDLYIALEDKDAIGTLKEDGTVEKEYWNQGWIYKSYDNFENKKGICYITEYGADKINDKSISGKDYHTFDSIVSEVKEYLEQEGVDIAKVSEQHLYDMAYDVFEIIDWQSPNAVIGENLLEELLYEYGYLKGEEEDNQI